MAALIGGAIMLAACSGGVDQKPRGAQIEGGEEFVALVEQARGAMGEGNLPEAGGLLDQAFALEPENPALWVEIARLRYRGGEHLPALEAAEKALELGPESALALYLRAQLVRDAHGLADALPWFEAAHAAAPDDTEILADLAATLGDLGRNQDMLVEVRKLAELDRSHPKVHYLQALLAARAGQPIFARALLERSAMLANEVPAAVLLDALIDLDQGNYDSAAEKLTALSARQPSNTRVIELLALALLRGGRDEEVIKRFAGRAGSLDTSPYLLELLGRAHERMGDREAAAPYLQRAQDGRQRALFVLGTTADARAVLPAPTKQLRTMIANDDLRGAARLANSLQRQFPASADVHALVGDVGLAVNDPQQALELYQNAAQIRRPWPLTKRIIVGYRMAGNDDAADTLLVRHLAGEPNNAEAILMLARRSAEAQDWLRVALLLDHAIELGAGNDPELLTLRALAARGLERVDETERFAALAKELRPSDFAPPSSD